LTMKLAAGRELDNALVAEEVMGWIMHPSWGCLAPPGYPSEKEMWTPWEESWDDDENDWIMTRKPIKGKLISGMVMDGSGKPKLPDYLGDITAAWQVVEKMRENGILLRIEVRASCYVVRAVTWDVDNDCEKLLAYSGQDTAPLAICLAALKAVGVDVAEEGV
jgi:hypothetical protein